MPASHPGPSTLPGDRIPGSRDRYGPLPEQAHQVSTRESWRDPSAQRPGWLHTGGVRKVAAVAPRDSQCPDFTKLGISSCTQLRRALPRAVAARAASEDAISDAGRRIVTFSQSSVLPERHWPLDCPKRRMRTPTATNQTWRAAACRHTSLDATNVVKSCERGASPSSSFTGLPTPEGPGSAPKRHSCRRGHRQVHDTPDPRLDEVIEEGDFDWFDDGCKSKTLMPSPDRGGVRGQRGQG